MTQEYVDIALDDNFDISIAENGDFTLVDSFATSLVTTFYTNARAATSEVATIQNQKGWWGNLFPISPEFEIGSKVWLLDQSPATQLALNQAVDYTRKAYQWLLDYNYADDVKVTGQIVLTTLTITVEILKNTEIITQKVFELWGNTVNG